MFEKTPKMFDPWEAGRYWLRYGETAASAWFIVAARIWMMASLGPGGRRMAREMGGMVAEKQKAALDAALAFNRGLLQGGATPLTLAEALLKPYHAKTRSNTRRLGRRLGRL